MTTTHRRPPAPQPELYRFTGLDFGTVGLYVAVAAFFALAGELLLPFLRQLAPSPAVASYGVNLVFYGSVGTLALFAARRVVARDLRVLATRPWFTLMMVPGGGGGHDDPHRPRGGGRRRRPDLGEPGRAAGTDAAGPGLADGSACWW